MTGPDRFDVEGTAVWRTLFSIPVGVVYAVGTDAAESNVDWQKMRLIWLAFLLAEAVMSVYCVWWIRKYWW
jgi:Na+-driven multidrug efflux pump